MPFQCPNCSSQGSLRITASLELPPDARSDEISLQVVQCSNCNFCGLTVYEELRRGAFNSEMVNHTGYYMHDGDQKSVVQMIKKCPKPADPRCSCSSHRKLGRKNNHGQWDGLDEIQSGSSFCMKLD
ncbi:MAG: hypothetical protein A2Z14_16790 [Chloroflexi bacterium RBG_16_48_8]|nr:MAG: hypothetical protein A2Z14_16790 [Chloroflexi bacterium RBG_16_48_8]